jgi:hypothetical protein
MELVFAPGDALGIALVVCVLMKGIEVSNAAA